MENIPKFTKKKREEPKERSKMLDLEGLNYKVEVIDRDWMT